MATPLETSVQKRSQPYHKEDIPVLGGQDTDSGDISRPKHRFKSLRNYRIERPGEITTRTGHTVVESHDALHPLAKCEFVGWAVRETNQTEHRYDVTVYRFESAINVRVVQKIAPYDWNDVNIANDIPDDPLTDVIQYGSSLIVTIYGVGMWEVYNTQDDGLGAWKALPLGKELCPLPTEINYADTIQADLYVYDSGRNSFPAALDGQTSLEPLKLDDGTYSIIKTPMNATYYLADNYMDGAGTPENSGLLHEPKRWVFHEEDNDLGEGRTVSSRLHLRTNAWGYKFVFVRKYKRAGGQEFIVRSHPSVDMWVRDSIYCPPIAVTWDDSTNTAGPVGALRYYEIGEGGKTFREYPQDEPAAGDFPAANRIAVPSTEAMNKFRGELLRYMGYEDPGTGDDKIFTFRQDDAKKHLAYAVFTAGYRDVPEAVWSMGWAYEREKSAYDLKRAPCIEFSFDDFALSDLETITEIEVYRTAYGETKEDENEPENIDSALFQPHKYGYVGSIKPNESFLDDVPDEEIVFASTPDIYEGFLQTQFSGSLLREYGRKVAIANIENNYWVFRPTLHLQAFLLDDLEAPETGYSNDDLQPPGGGDAAIETGRERDTISFHYAYVDVDGNQSDFQDIEVEGLRAGLGLKHVVFLFPVGYAPSITGIRLYRSLWDAGTQTRSYFHLTDLSITDEHYVSDNTEAATSTALGKNVVSNNEPGAVMYSAPNEPYHWPALHQEVIDPINPINAMEVLLGQLWIQSDGSTHLTLLAGPGQERGEEETKHLGCIARRGWGKVDKVFFFLSQHGLYYMEASGPVPVPNANTEILAYLREEIEGQPALANARRATLGVLKRRDEVWLHFPSSRDLGGLLPHRTFIFKLIGGNVTTIENYEFDLTEDFAPRNFDFGQPETQAQLNHLHYRSYTVLFSAHGDGRLFSSHFDTRLGKLFTIEHDTEENCPVAASWTLACSLGMPTTAKTLRKVDVRMKIDAVATVYTGQARPDGLWDAIRGHISGRSRPYQLTVSAQKDMVYEHEPMPRSSERTSGVIHVRCLTTPNPQRWNNHQVTVKGITLWLDPVHDHP